MSVDELRGSAFLEYLAGLGRTKGMNLSQERPRRREQLPLDTSVSGRRAVILPTLPGMVGEKTTLTFDLDVMLSGHNPGCK